MKKSLSWVLGVLAVAAAPAAFASPVIITDQVDVAATNGSSAYGSYASANFANTPRDGRYWGDEISGATSYDTTQIIVNRNAGTNTVALDLITHFPGSDPAAPAKYADIFINTTDPNNFNGPYTYGIALGSQTQSAGVYSVGSFATSDDLWASQTQFIFGGYAQPNAMSPAFDPSIALASPVRITSGTQMADYGVTVGQTDLGGGLYDLSVLITSASNIDLFNDFSLFWATADCSNDAIWGTVSSQGVPEPVSLSLFGFGLLGVGFGRRRNV